MNRAVLAAYAPEDEVVSRLLGGLALSPADRAVIGSDARELVEAVRRRGQPGLLDAFLVRYGLGSDEGVALMSLAEALLRVPDQATVDALIADKLEEGDWTAKPGGSSLPLDFLSQALNLTTGVLASEKGALAGAVRRLGEPVIRAATRQAMGWLGSQFVFGETIAEAEKRAPTIERAGYRFSYDMLGEAARTAADAARYREAYAHAIAVLARRAASSSVRDNPGISVKLSALHPRYEFAKREGVMQELVATTRDLARAAAAAGIGFNIDAEEQARLPLSLEVIAAVLDDEKLRGWDGFGIVVQAYGRRASIVLDRLEALAERLDRRLMVRLVKGAYWDTEIKLAQLGGFPSFPVFTRKAATDVSYMACARKLLASRRLYPQFATHNAHSAAAVLHLARQAGRSTEEFEFQRLHGMGRELHDVLHERVPGLITRIYAPVGTHADLLPYLVRRLLENGAGASFLHQIADPNVPVDRIVRDPIAELEALAGNVANPAIKPPADIYLPLRANSRGFDLSDPAETEVLDKERAVFRSRRWRAGPIIAGPRTPRPSRPVTSPSDPADIIGDLEEADGRDIEAALGAAIAGAPAWAATSPAERSAILHRAADLYEGNAAEFMALLAREGGRTVHDAVGELREACDYLRFYAGEGERLAALGMRPRGVVACISPWNFPLAIFTGQIAGALAGGNAVIAKPAEATPLIAARAVALLLEAGVPPAALQLLPGSGSAVGAALSGDRRIAGIAFTGSLPTARKIERAMAGGLAPDAPLVAETGGVNAMIVDSTALPEQAVRDIVASAFQSAGQRCSALRLLYLQDEIFDRTLSMLKGAMDELSLGDPWLLSTDIGPVIDAAAKQRLDAYVAGKLSDERLLHRLAT
ncbi:MAG TPA: bifunctional proline dehydrogenase/L-glutamate gamma-semialdehyde dehydrogenase PutA, partial [Devosia sp.]|nr:bifunctional proline dehydrogenase/L-glutamate gamma-semialdehyde dehydrogenase PutA [Devosia sp.]